MSLCFKSPTMPACPHSATSPPSLSTWLRSITLSLHACWPFHALSMLLMSASFGWRISSRSFLRSPHGSTQAINEIMFLEHLVLWMTGHTVGPLNIYIHTHTYTHSTYIWCVYVCVCATYWKVLYTVYLYVHTTHVYEISRELPCITHYKLMLCDIKSLCYLLKQLIFPLKP